MKKFMLTLLISFSFLGLWSQSLLLEENFDYTAGQLTDVNGGANVSSGNWISYSGTALPLMVSSGSLTYTGYISSGIGNKVEVWYGSAEDAYRSFTPQLPGSTIYVAFILNVTQTTGLAANTNTNGDYTISLLPSTSTSILVGRVSIRAGSVANTFNLGLRTTSSNATDWIATDFTINTPVLVVLKYELISANTNDVASLWVNPAIGTAEPTADITQVSALTTDPSDLGRISLRQGTNSFPGQIDGIRVTTTWEEAVKAPDTQAPVATFNPLNNATNVPVNSTMTISFDEPIRNLDNSVIDNSNVASLITLKETNASGVDVPFTATIDATKKIITITPTANLAFNQLYYLSIGIVEDAYNNSTVTQSITFTTEAASTEAEILSFDISGQISSTINSTNATVDVVMPYGTDVTNLSPTITVSANATISPASGVAQDFTNPVTYTVTAQDNSTKIWTVTVSTQLNNQAEIVSFDITNQVSSTINSTNATVDILMPFGTDVTNLIPTITVSAGATISPASSVAQDFTNPVTYTVTAQDNSTKTWTVSVSTQLNNQAEIVSFDIPNQVSSTINSTNATVDITMPIGTDPTNLIPTITVSTNATISPASGVAQDFTNPVIYTVTAEDNTTKIWTVTVTVLTPTVETIVEWTFPNNPDDNIADGGIAANLSKSITTNSSGTVTYTTASGATTSTARNDGWDNGMDTKYWMISFTTEGYKDITLSSKQRSSNTGPKDFKAQYSLDGTNWVDIAPVTVANNFTTGVLTDVALPSACNNQYNVYVRWIMTSNTSVSNATVASTGASNIDDIYVKGIAFLSNEAEILSFNIPNQVSSTINSTNATVDVVMPYGTDVTNLTPTITVSAGASINPTSGTTQDFSSAVQYIVTAADATIKTWTVNVATQAASTEAEILTFDIPGQLNSTINSSTATVDVVMPMGTDLTNLTPTITISANATINPQSGVAQNFSSAVQYTVTAQDGTTNKVWTVNVTTQLNNQADIVTFDIPNQVSSTINTADTTVTVVMPYGTDVTALVPAITVSQGASISPLSGVAQDFSNPVQYTVTAENGTDQKVWTVTVTLDAPVYTSIVEWTFPNNPDDSIADGGITANLDKILTTTATGSLSFTYAGASTYCARTTGWDNGTDTKYWRIDFTTIGYKEIKFSSKQRSSSTGPRDFKVQYMLNNDGNWLDLQGTTIACADNWTLGVINDYILPSACDQQSIVSLRWIMTSDTAVGGTIIASTGSSRIDDIIVKGIEDPLSITAFDKENIIVYPNPTTEWLHIHSADRILNATIIGLDGKTIPVIWNNDAIDVHSLTTGMYILNISTLNKTYKVNFVKQ
ncbi:MAG: hypothetical protein Fur0028_00770 [Bacteroidales bacterium]